MREHVKSRSVGVGSVGVRSDGVHVNKTEDYN